MEKVVRKYKCSHCNLLSERKFNLRVHYGRAHKDVPVGFKSGNLKVVNVPREVQYWDVVDQPAQKITNSQLLVIEPLKIESLDTTMCLAKWNFWSNSANILLVDDMEICINMCNFVGFLREQQYLPDEIHYIVLGIQKHLMDNDKNLDLFNNPYFFPLQNELDSLSKEYIRSMAGLSNQATTCIYEYHLWESEQLGSKSNKVLLNTIIYLNMKLFNMLKLEDHIGLTVKDMETRIAQLEDYTEYDVSDLISIYTLYCEKCAPGCDSFYAQPLFFCKPESKTWYRAQQMCNKILEKVFTRWTMVEEMPFLS